MGADSKIGWCDHTFNPWIGCQKVGPGCDHCYAEAWDKRTGGSHWGPHAPRRMTSDRYWRQPEKWSKAAAATGSRATVFAASMADVFDKRGPEIARNRLWMKIRQTKHLIWLLVTKRIGNAAAMLPADWGESGYPNVMIISTICTQAEAERDIPKLLRLPCCSYGLSVEPMLEPIDLRPWLSHREPQGDPKGIEVPSLQLDWVIVGGESGPHARDFDEQAAANVVLDCGDYHVPAFVKQMGSRWAKRRYGHNRDPKGENIAFFPTELRVREFPEWFHG